MRKIIGSAAGITGGILLIAGILWKAKGSLSVSVIGGADGPTSVFIAGKLGDRLSACPILIGIVLLLIAGFIFFRHKR